MNRLRCRYARGPIINGEPEFGWRDFGGPVEKLMLPTPIMKEAADEIERLRAEVAQLREWLEADARCPCCDTVDACLDDCTFEADCPQDAERMAEVRALLAARKGEA